MSSPSPASYWKAPPLVPSAEDQIRDIEIQRGTPLSETMRARIRADVLRQQAKAERPPGVTSREIEDWEMEFGVSLPALLKRMLSGQNGGDLADGPISILPLADINPPPDADGLVVQDDPAATTDASRIFLFGEHEHGYLLLLNYNPPFTEDPAIYGCWPGDGGYFHKKADSLEAFFCKELAVSPDCPIRFEMPSGYLLVSRTEGDCPNGICVSDTRYEKHAGWTPAGVRVVTRYQDGNGTTTWEEECLPAAQAKMTLVNGCPRIAFHATDDSPVQVTKAFEIRPGVWKTIQEEAHEIWLTLDDQESAKKLLEKMA